MLGGSIYKPTTDITLFAIWSRTSYKISFNPNNGTGSMEEINVLPENKTTLPSNTFIKEGWSFKAWNTDKSGKGTKYEDGATIENLETSITLYAIWEENINITLSVTNNKIIETSKISMGAEATTGIQKVELKVGENKLYTEEYNGSKKYEKNNLSKENLDKTAFENLPFYEIGLDVTVTTTAGNTKTKTFSCKNYTIGNANALEGFAQVVDNGNSLLGETVYLLKDLNVSSHNPIGIHDGSPNTMSRSKYFGGIFEGNNHTINISLYANEVLVGLFGVTYGATIRNVTVTGSIPQGYAVRSV